MMFFRKKNRMTKLEKKEAAKLKKAKKDAIHDADAGNGIEDRLSSFYYQQASEYDPGESWVSAAIRWSGRTVSFCI